ncbi:carbohydrate ABC transporter membrane protein 1, CUT1 family [Trichormus variabilis ATCC 29413]|uniref:Carbohydrate ABC transporter membrane protein 1, CUT1 family n=2 Tax=Anabaena variabilis TaxID=264691 RepID=Q3M451_TRIV2|nr:MULTISPECIES: sugar ABC transporter permease [Nostocaceae]ABA24235.1 carbohydrate ABC transporter membrane protein 1, CUT1 family [Trichormus variabilis ATCC 29413]MBC1214053.1 sugar ABC transporter permease [Trichormus variabilis ARAD]MBC1254603.1 sugar ABC transporter permease [Trichormus variabilis V5]MBC1268619.1 sugar ABC transporter permease [Trichormus variabilis FSR]MBC1302487.1 sugar ABC transporter permease [Trichormus variabilis N2B]
MNQLTVKDWILIKRRLTPYLFLLPALILLGLTVFWPALQAFYLSFTSYEDLSQPPQWIGIKNFLRLWKDAVFWKTLENTFLYLVAVVPILVIAPLGLAILVNQKLRGINWFRAAYYTPVVISMVVAGIAWKWLYAENGLLNQLLKTIGLFPEGIPWLTTSAKVFGIVPISLASVMAVTIWKGLGYYMVIYLAGLQSIPADVYEAAAIDGSDGISKHWDITIPLMKPYLALVAVISAISATKVFEEVYIMTQGGPLNSSKTIVYYLYEQAFSNLEISYACTIGLVLFLIILALSVLRLVISQPGGDGLV